MATRVDALAANYLVQRMAELRMIRRIRVPNPAAGADWSTKVPGGMWWELRAVQASFTTSAVVAGRAPQLQVVDADGVVSYRVTNASQQAASSGVPILWASGIGVQITNFSGTNSLPTPPIVVMPGESVGTVTGAIDVGDQWSAIVLTVRELAPDRIAQAFGVSESDVIGLLGEPSTDDYQI